MDKKRSLALATALATVALATPALAVTSTTLVITEAQENVPQARIQLFDADTGAEVKPTEDDDDESALFLLDGGSYRVAVDGKTVREITVSGEGSRTFVIEVPTGAPSPAAAMPALTGAPPPTPESGSLLVNIFFGGGVGRTDVPQTSAGVVRTSGGDEGPAGVGPNRVNFNFLQGGITFPLGGVSAFVDGHHAFGNGRTTPFSVAPGSVDGAGFSFGRETADSTGLILGSFGGIDGTLTTDFNETSIRFGVRLPLGASDAQDSIFSISPFVHYDRRSTTLASDLFLTNNIPNFLFDIGQQREDKITDTWFTVGITPSVTFPLAAAVSAHIDLTGEAGIFRSKLNSLERNWCDLCGPEHQDFTIETMESDSSFRFRGGAGAGVDFNLSPRTRLGTFVLAQFFDIGTVSHPVTGDDVLAGETTRAGRDSSFGLSVGVSMESWW
jgi:hypothetical protein